MIERLRKLPDALLPWYADNRRDLPWRQDKDPYHIWVSEIMLQQTRVEAVKGYYARFLQELPTISDLAECDDDRLHKLWEGLGYYTRVRNLRKAARQIMYEHDGRFPTTYAKILALPGIGEYTAGAICSIAFDQPTPAVDGNVLRVISRITDDSTPVDLSAYKKSVQEKLAAIYSEQAGDFTQALMELGATICGPNHQPDCENCPCKDFCLGFQRNTAHNLPVKRPKRERKIEEKTVFILSCDGKYAIEERADKGLLAGLWELPWSEEGYFPFEGVWEEIPGKVRHVFTHFELELRFFAGRSPLPEDFRNTGIFVRKEEFANYAFSTLMKKVLKELEQKGSGV